MKKIGKQWCSLLVLLVLFGGAINLFAQEQEVQEEETEEQETKEGFGYQLAVSLSFQGLNIPIPYAQFAVTYTKPLDFGDNPIFSGANIMCVLGPTLTPITLDTQAGIIFTPSPILNIGLGATAGSGWAIGDSHGIGLYNQAADKYEQSLPFTVWRYSFCLQTNFQFDFGAIFPGEWTHIVITANEQLYYEGNTAAKKYDLWEWTSGIDYVNGFNQSGNVMLGYMFPEKKFRLIGLALAWQSLLDGCDYGIYAKNFDGDFVNLVLGLQAMIYLNDNNQLAISSSLSSQRAFLEPASPNSSNIKKTASGREWSFTGVTVQWVYTF
jgi:hypothetical protein